MPHASGPFDRPRADRLANRDRILDAYVGLLARGARPGLEEVAAAAGVGRTTVYRHFGDLVGLRAAAFLAALEASARFALASIEWPIDDRAQNRRFDALLAPLARLVEVHQRTGAIDPALPPRFVAEAFGGLVESASLHVGALAEHDAAATVARLLLGATSPPAGIGGPATTP